MRPYQNLERFKRNVDTLSRHTSSMRAFQIPAQFSSRLVLLGNNCFNIDIGNGSLLYPEDSLAAATRQADDYLAQPLRFRVPRCKGTEGTHTALDQLYERLDSRLSGFPPRAQPLDFGGFVVVLGLGLGLHIEHLMSKLRFKTLIVIEPVAEFLIHSLHVVNWEKIVSTLKRNGREIVLVGGQDPVKMVQGILSGRNFPCIDNSYIYQHYRSDDFAALSKWLVQGLDLGIASGWYEDQITTIRNNLANFSVPGLHILKAPLSEARTFPALVIGAGPSLDAQVETIRALRDKAILITASSALRVLLENGIRPDIHCEVENTDGLGDVAESLSAKHGLKDVVLFAASTVNPRIAPCFRETIYFFRPRVSATVLLGREENATEFATPTAGNAAVYCAAALGFKDVFLFGLDFGARDPERHHSRHSVYFNYESADEIATYTPYDMNLRVPANFGGQAFTGPLLMEGANTIGAAIRATPGMRVGNCSDGVSIPSTQSRTPDTLTFPQPQWERSREIALILSRMDYHDGAVVDGENLAERFVAGFDAFMAQAQSRLVAFAKSRIDDFRKFVELGDALWSTLDSVGETHPAVRLTLYGHLHLMLQGAFLAAGALEDRDRQDGGAIIAEEMVQSLERLRHDLQIGGQTAVPKAGAAAE